MKGARAQKYASYRYRVNKITAESIAGVHRPHGHTLDHMIPIRYGFKKGVPPELIGDIRNLEYVPFQDNLSDGARITDRSIVAMRRLGLDEMADIELYRNPQLKDAA